jgi:serine/threonine protein kinase
VDRALLINNKSVVSDARREELVSVLVNLSRNLRHRSAFGSVSGSSFRSERLLDILLKDVEPVRHQNEPVAPGSPWILRRHLGMGSFGEVWMAENKGFPIPRAYKFFKDGSGEWLRREQTNLVATLNLLKVHDHIVEFKDVQTDCPYPYLALEYLGGGSLEEWMVKDKDDRPKMEAREIIRQVVSALAAAHSVGITHRDVKPANILLTVGATPYVKIGDFGLGRVASSVSKRGENSQLASLGGLVGTSLYLPPEAQQRGRRAPSQDDVFAVGVVWYQLLMDVIERPPYDFAERLRSKGVDSRTVGLIERCLAHPDRRYMDCQKLRDGLDDLLPPPRQPVPGRPYVDHIALEYLSVMS